MARLSIDHPLRKLFRTAIRKSFPFNPVLSREAAFYLEEEILCEFLHIDNLFKIRDSSGRRLEDIADMLAEGDIRLKAKNFDREFLVHKHIGDYTLFMLGLFPEYLKKRKGKEFVLGSLIIPGGDLSKLYLIQGQRSYQIAASFGEGIFKELSENFEYYRNTLEFVRLYLETSKDEGFRRAKRIITE